MIPLIDLKAQHESIRSELDEAVARVVDSSEFVLGGELARFEDEFARYCGAAHAVGVGNGTDALILALKALGVGEGDEVVTTPFTFSASAEAIIHAGAKPVFVDIEAGTLNLDPARLDDALSLRTKAIIPVHLFGQPCRMDAIIEIAEEHGVAVVEDSAQAHGARYGGRRTGSFGAAGCFSFYPGKNLGALGDAGIVVSSSRMIAERVRMLRDHGRKEKYTHEVVGFNSRLDCLQAAVLSVKLRRLDEWNERRRKHAAHYRRLLTGDERVGLPEVSEGAEHVYHLFVVRVPDRDRVVERMRGEGIGVGVHYPAPLHLQASFRELGYGAGDFPVAEKAAAEVLSLPVYPELSETQIEFISEVLGRSLQRR
ncbi:MAG: DegT/DnrJ/EryC1/StrS family aminotransferase [bacterium]